MQQTGHSRPCFPFSSGRPDPTSVTSVTVSVLTLVAVACDRLYAVAMPLRARNATACPSATIAAIWVVSVLVALPSFYMRDLQIVQVVFAHTYTLKTHTGA